LQKDLRARSEAYIKPFFAYKFTQKFYSFAMSLFLTLLLFLIALLFFIAFLSAISILHSFQ